MALTRAKKQSLKKSVKGPAKKQSAKAGVKAKLIIPKAAMKKAEFFRVLAEQSGISKSEARSVIESMKAIIKVHLVKQGPGVFKLPGFLKMTIVNKAATKAKKGINPFTGEEMMFKAKPARRVVKAKILKQFKDALS